MALSRECCQPTGRTLLLRNFHQLLEFWWELFVKAVGGFHLSSPSLSLHFHFTLLFLSSCVSVVLSVLLTNSLHKWGCDLQRSIVFCWQSDGGVGDAQTPQIGWESNEFLLHVTDVCFASDSWKKMLSDASSSGCRHCCVTFTVRMR